jgi:hypothetical protein
VYLHSNWIWIPKTSHASLSFERIGLMVFHQGGNGFQPFLFRFDVVFNPHFLLIQRDCLCQVAESDICIGHVLFPLNEISP